MDKWKNVKDDKIIVKGEKKAVLKAVQVFLDLFEKGYRNGHKSSVLECIAFCLGCEPQIDIPMWCRDAFCEVMEKNRQFEFKSWDEAFDTPHPKGTQHETRRELYERRVAVFERIEELKAAGNPVDRGLFEMVSKELRKWSLSAGLAEKDYYYVKKIRTKYIAANRPDWINSILDHIFVES